MGTFLFIENREKTWFWDAVAAELERRGHKISWIVQNPMFTPKLTRGDVHVIPFPRADQMRPYDFTRNPVLEAERGLRYFEAGSGHFAYYEEQIDAIIEAVQPDISIGELTLFHELITIERLAARGMVFIHPSAERFPQGRFGLHIGRTQVPYCLSGNLLDQDDANQLSENIRTRREVLIYMQSASFRSRLRSLAKWFLGRLRVSYGRWRGEKFNTPSARRKLALTRATRALCARWQAASSLIQPGERAILYPMQMQPESSIDVWGYPYFDQVALIKRLLAASPEDLIIALKANPKSKYEMSARLVEFAIRHPRIRLLPLETKMDQAQPLCIGAITVCGTVGLEAVFGIGRCMSLRHPILETHFPDFSAETPEEGIGKLLFEPQTGTGSPVMGSAYLQAIAAQSFVGWISDPLGMPSCLSRENIALVADGLECGLAQASPK